MIEAQIQYDLGRAKNAVQDFMIHKLLFPKIYFDTSWSDSFADVIAIDRSGTGDVHAIQIRPVKSLNNARESENHLAIRIGPDSEFEIESITPLDAHFRYLALLFGPGQTEEFENVAEYAARSIYRHEDHAIKNLFLAPDGVGRVGIFSLHLSEFESELRVQVKPERFRSSKELTEMADQFVASHTPNWEVRE